MMLEPHATRTPSGIEIPDPDQGTPVIAIQFAMPSTMIEVFEPFDADQVAESAELAKCGHNLPAFAARWEAFSRGRDPFLVGIEPRFGYRQLIPRSAIPHVVQIYVHYHRRDDVRAGHRGHRGLALPGQPSVRALGGGAYAVAIPTR
jgi:hypothetical protein